MEYNANFIRQELIGEIKLKTTKHTIFFLKFT